MLKTYRVKVKMTHYETYEIDANSLGEAKATYDEGKFCSTTEAEPEQCWAKQIK